MIDDILNDGEKLKRRLDELRAQLDGEEDSNWARRRRPGVRRHGRGAMGGGTGAVGAGFGNSASSLRSELGLLLDDVGSLVRNEAVINPELKSKLDDKFNQARTLVSDFAEETRVASRRLADEAELRVVDGLETARESVAERPISSVLAAAAIGMTVGMLLSNRR